jgi:hypothetical protein
MKKPHADWIKSCKGIGWLQLGKEAITIKDIEIAQKPIKSHYNKTQLLFSQEVIDHYNKIKNEHKKHM